MFSDESLSHEWASNSRWHNVTRPYSPEDVLKSRGSLKIEHTIAKISSIKLWNSINSGSAVRALGALTGNQAVQQVLAGLKSIYVSGWQVAADANLSCTTYPDLSLYPSNSVPHLVQRINSALQRADQISTIEGKSDIDWFVPLVADAEAGFGGNLNAHELMKAMIGSGAAGVHFEDQLSSAKKCGHLGGKVLVPTREFIQKLIAARLAADIAGVPTVLMARTDANSAKLVTSDIDDRDKPFIHGSRTSEGFYNINGGIECAIARSLSYAPYADLLWCETSNPNIEEAKKFADAIHKEFPSQHLAYNCSPSFRWKKFLSDNEIANFQQELFKMGYTYQFITWAGFNSLNHGMFKLAGDYRDNDMTAYVNLQEQEFSSESHGYTATKHQGFAGTGYFDHIMSIITGGESSTAAMSESTEKEQF